VSSALATPVNQIAAGVLDVGYADIGPADGPAVVLLHGWPLEAVSLVVRSSSHVRPSRDDCLHAKAKLQPDSPAP
jgi:pimeloyl-ACP methyl ester carboxylesterase